MGAARARPSISSPALRAVSANLTSSRYNSGVPQEDPKTKAQSVLDALPGSSLVSKAAILSAGAGVSVAAISNEIYVLNEESIVAFCLLTVWWSVFHYGGPAFNSWADSQRDKMSSVLNTARKNHTDSVKERIENVKELSGVIDITKSLFAVSKETATLEAQAFELEQKANIAAEAKAVLDSWVRYEGQVKARQQRELAESVITKINKELENPKVLKQILDQAVADVERIISKKA